jgi:hypothetical protein
MHQKKPLAKGLGTNLAQEHQLLEHSAPERGTQSSPKPTILGDIPLPRPRPLPGNFATDAHRESLSKTPAKPATPTDYARLISELKQNKK